jgi:hypothetical protein
MVPVTEVSSIASALLSLLSSTVGCVLVLAGSTSLVEPKTVVNGFSGCTKPLLT